MTNTTIEISTVRVRLLQHSMYTKLDRPEHVRTFMEHHVFAVWDFMSLLKRLQQDLTCVVVPWVPQDEPRYARFINEIVLGEESDEDGQGGYTDHFGLYLQAMEQVGANTQVIREYIKRLKNGGNPLVHLQDLGVPQTVYDFVKHTLDTSMYGKTHEVCAAFFYGREELIPDMFQALVDELEGEGAAVDRLLYYLHRHIELDGDEHGPLAESLLAFLCDDDPTRIAEAQAVAVRSLEMRIRLWDGVVASL